MAIDKILTKNYNGDKHVGGGGAGDFSGLREQKSYEYMGVHKSAPNPAPEVKDGPGTTGKTGDISKGINLHASGYAGPQNWQPENKGTVNPDDIHHG